MIVQLQEGRGGEGVGSGRKGGEGERAKGCCGRSVSGEGVGRGRRDGEG